MKKKKNTTEGENLRRLAENALENSLEADDDLLKPTPKDPASLIHELRVHQIELKIQNEELRRIQEELEKARDRYSNLYDFAPTGYMTVTEKGIIKEANLTIATMLGEARGLLIGKFFSHFVLPEDQDILYKHWQHLLEKKAPQVCELRLVKKDGHSIFVRLDCAVTKSNEDDLDEVRAAVSDISGQKQMESSLQQAQKLESIGTLAGGVAHEFNNILSIIIGNNELVMDDLPEWSPLRENTEEIRMAGLRAKDIVKQLLLFSRQADAQKTPIYIGSVVKEAMKLIRPTTPANIDIYQNIGDDVAPIIGNATQIHQILINLCGNAADAMINTGGAITIDLKNGTIDEEFMKPNASLCSNRYVKLTVQDTGHGMDKNTLMRIFDPYFTTKKIGKGTGIGLAVVHGIVENHNGLISCESAPGKGTVFTILIPAYEGRVEKGSEPKIVLPIGNERILFVDDEPSLIKLGKQRLEGLGYTVQGSTDPSEALAMFEAAPNAYDLVITDMAMPHMTGDQLTTKILQIRPDMPIIVCTGYSEKLSETEAREIGIRSFVMKPLDKNDFAMMVRKVLDEAKGTVQE